MKYVPDLNTFLDKVANEDPKVLEDIVFKPTQRTGLLLYCGSTYMLSYIKKNTYRINCIVGGGSSSSTMQWSTGKMASSFEILSIAPSKKLRGPVEVTLGAAFRKDGRHV